MKRHWTYITAAAVALLLLAGPALAQTSGDLRGQVTDQEGGVLPGVTVTLDSDEVLGGPWVRVTGADGFYQFPRLQPGEYVITFALEGFGTQERPDVPVRLDQTTEINATLSLAAIAETIVVTAEAPVVDPEQTGVQQTFTSEYLNKATIGSGNRSYQSVVSQAAGTTPGSNPQVFGATLGENQYQIDGITTTDPVTTTFGTNFNYDAIQEVAFHSSGYEAEYGGATGGFVNVITKSGGNRFAGTVDVRYRDTDFQESGDHFDPDLQEVEFLNPGATLGGPILRDRLWFYAAYEFTSSELTPSGSATTRDFEGNYYLGKLSYQISDSWRGVAKWTSDPADIANADADFRVAEEATTFQEQGGDIYQASVDGIFGQSLFWDFKVGINRQELNAFPQSQSIDGPVSHFNLDTGVTTRNAANAQFSERDRDEYKTSLTWFLDELGGSHELKVGAEYNDLRFQSENFTTAGGFEYLDGATEEGQVVPLYLDFRPNPGPAEHEGTLTTAFVQDAWRLSDQLTIKAGVRYDTVAYDNESGMEVADMDKVQPRLGFAWDLTGRAETVVRGSWGRFMHPNALTLPSFARLDNLPSFRYFSCSLFAAAIGLTPQECSGIGGDFTRGGVTVPRWLDDPDGADPFGYFLGSLFASQPNQIADGLDPMYTEEWTVGIERSLTPKTSIEISYVDREWNDIFEDTCNGNLEGGFSEDAECDFYVMANLPQLRREYQGAFVRFETRDVADLYLIASYTYSDAQSSVGYNQNAGSDFDIFPYHFTNRFGRSERDHRVKLNGFYDLPLDFVLGFDAAWASDFPWEERRRLGGDLYGQLFLDPRGSRDGEDFWQLDLELSKYFRFDALDLRLIGTVLNVFSEEAVTEVCEIEQGCGGFDAGDPVEWQNPRRYEIGVRIEF